MQDSFDSELIVFTQDAQKNRRKKNMQWIMSNVTMHTHFARVLTYDPKHAHVIDITRAQSTCMHLRTAVDHREWVVFNSSSQLPTCQYHSRRQAKRNRHSSSMHIGVGTGGPWAPPPFSGWHTHSSCAKQKQWTCPFYQFANSLLSALSQNHASFFATLLEIDC